MVSHDTCKVQLTHATAGLSTRAVEGNFVSYQTAHPSLGQVVLDHIVQDHRYIGGARGQGDGAARVALGGERRGGEGVREGT